MKCSGWDANLPIWIKSNSQIDSILISSSSIHPLPFTHPSVGSPQPNANPSSFMQMTIIISFPSHNQKACTASDIWICKQFTNGRNQILLFLLIIHGQLHEQLNLQLYLIISLLSLRTLYSCAHSLLAYYDCHKTAHECCCLSVLSEKPMLQTKNNDTFPFWESWLWSWLKCNYSPPGHWWWWLAKTYSFKTYMFLCESIVLLKFKSFCSFGSPQVDKWLAFWINS